MRKVSKKVVKKEPPLPAWYRNAPDWKKVLYAWRHEFNRTGLTIHALATICNRPPQEIMREIRATPGVYPQFCSVVKAPVWSYNGNEHVNPMDRQYAHWLILTDWTVEKYPWPRHKGVEALQGQTNLTRIAGGHLDKLRQIVAGKYVPAAVRRQARDIAEDEFVEDDF